MSLFDIPESDWAIGEPPPSPSFENYNSRGFNDVLPYDLCFVIMPEVNGRNSLIGIKITPSMPGYVSPADELETRLAGYADQ